jgi:hypothetical protein
MCILNKHVYISFEIVLIEIEIGFILFSLKWNMKHNKKTNLHFFNYFPVLKDVSLQADGVYIKECPGVLYTTSYCHVIINADISKLQTCYVMTELEK